MVYIVANLTQFIDLSIRRRYCAIGSTGFNLLTGPFQIAAKASHCLAAGKCKTTTAISNNIDKIRFNIPQFSYLGMIIHKIV